MPADAASPIPPALDQLRAQRDVDPGEVPDLLERLARVPDPAVCGTRWPSSSS